MITLIIISKTFSIFFRVGIKRIMDVLGIYDNQGYNGYSDSDSDSNINIKNNGYSNRNSSHNNNGANNVVLYVIIILSSIFIILPIVTLVKLDKLIRDNTGIKLDNNTYNVIRWNSISWIIGIIAIIIIFGLLNHRLSNKYMYDIILILVYVLFIIALIILLVYSVIAVPVFMKFAKWYKTVPNKDANTYNLVLAQIIIQLIFLSLLFIGAIALFINKHSRK